LGGGDLAVKGLTSSSSSPTPATFVITNVLQKPYDTAKTLLEAQGLIVAAPVYQVDETVLAGTVLKQSPDVNATVKKGDTVTLTVSRGAAKVPVPDLTDMTLSQAQNALLPLNLGIGTKNNEASDTVAKGSVIRQDPVAGVKVQPGSLIDVWISLGPSQVTLPDVTCLTLAAAKTQLLALGLNTLNGGTTGTTTNPLCPQPNRIAAMDPAANTKVNVGSTVTVYFNPTPSPS
jgi:serine/threonine-protein kinase